MFVCFYKKHIHVFPSSDCKPYLDLNFQNGEAVDLSANNFTIDDNFVTISQGAGDFSGRISNIAILGTANVEYYRDEFGLDVMFSPPNR